jgi:hypothetical protein
MSELKPELTPPYDPAAIPSYDVHFENNSRRTVPATELTPLLHLQPEDVSRRGSSTSSTSQWPALRANVGKNLAPLGLLIGFAAVVPFVGSWEWATKNNAALTLLVGLLAALATVAQLRR